MGRVVRAHSALRATGKPWRGTADPASTVYAYGMSTQESVSANAPTVGQRFPDIALPDQAGHPVDLHSARGSRKALVVFYRSARW
jgi:hypothetical protein